MISPIVPGLENKYQLQVIEVHDHHTTEWFGSLTLYPQDDGEIFIDISFSDQPVFHASHDRSCDHGDSGLFIECLSQTTLYEAIHEDTTGEFEQQIFHPIGLSINSLLDQED